MDNWIGGVAIFCKVSNDNVIASQTVGLIWIVATQCQRICIASKAIIIQNDDVGIGDITDTGDRCTEAAIRDSDFTGIQSARLDDDVFRDRSTKGRCVNDQQVCLGTIRSSGRVLIKERCNTPTSRRIVCIRRDLKRIDLSRINTR